MIVARHAFALAVVLPLLTASPASVRGAEIVGAVGAANGPLSGRAPSAPMRALTPGADIFFKDRIATRRGGSAQLVFLDRSTLNIGENSEVVIDAFLYRPDATGTMTARLTQGVLRFVGGDISHGGGTTIETPAATIGIRGGIGTIAYLSDPDAAANLPGVPPGFHGGTIVVNEYGTLTVRNRSREVTITREGFGVFVGPGGGPIGAPARIDAMMVRALARAATSRPGQSGGLSRQAAHGAVASLERLSPPTEPMPAASAMAMAPNALDVTAILSAGALAARDAAQGCEAAQALQVLRLATLQPSAPVVPPAASMPPSSPPAPTTPPPSSPSATPTSPSQPSAPPAPASAPSAPATSPTSTTSPPVSTAPSTMPSTPTPTSTPPATTSAAPPSQTTSPPPAPPPSRPPSSTSSSSSSGPSIVVSLPIFGTIVSLGSPRSAPGRSNGLGISINGRRLIGG